MLKLCNTKAVHLGSLKSLKISNLISSVLLLLSTSIKNVIEANAVRTKNFPDLPIENDSTKFVE